MTDQLISFKTAKLAKEKGFTWDICNNCGKEFEGNQYSPICPSCYI